MYKLSRYNYFVESGDRMIYLNGMTGNTFSVSQKEHEQTLSFPFLANPVSLMMNPGGLRPGSNSFA